MSELILNCNWNKKDEITIYHYENGESFKNDKLNILISGRGKELDLMLNEDSSLKLLEFLKQKLEEK